MAFQAKAAGSSGTVQYAGEKRHWHRHRLVSRACPRAPAAVVGRMRVASGGGRGSSEQGRWHARLLGGRSHALPGGASITFPFAA